MIPKLYTKDKVLIGNLSECSRAIAIEERNGMCEIEIDYQLFSPHYEQLVRGNIIEADLNDKITKQLFMLVLINISLKLKQVAHLLMNLLNFQTQVKTQSKTK